MPPKLLTLARAFFVHNYAISLTDLVILFWTQTCQSLLVSDIWNYHQESWPFERGFSLKE